MDDRTPVIVGVGISVCSAAFAVTAALVFVTAV